MCKYQPRGPVLFLKHGTGTAIQRAFCRERLAEPTVKSSGAAHDSHETDARESCGWVCLRYRNFAAPAPSRQNVALDNRPRRTGRADLAHRERTGYPFDERL